MSSRIAACFARLKADQKKALVPFVTAGDPANVSVSDLMHALVAGGADIIELGVPFSDPMADGPVIQRSSERALARKVGLTHIFEHVKTFRSTDATTPVVLMGYLNPIEIRGVQRFAQEAKAAGVDAVLLVDLPAEEAHDIRNAFAAEQLDLISLLSPTTSDARITHALAHSTGYIYYVSYAGVTGGAQSQQSPISERVQALRAQTRVPVLVGFGIKDAASAKAMGACSDGIIVGSALVEKLADAADPCTVATEFMRELRAGLDQA